MKLIEADRVKHAMKGYWKAQVDKALALTDGNEANKRINSYLEHNHELLKAIDKLPSAQPERKGTRLSTVCLLCKKPAVTFNTEDDIPYTNYSYCEDCLRKGLKLLREQKKNLQAQPERKTGRWIKTARWGRAYYCDQCRNYLDFDGVNAGRGSTNFCPNCGADMRGESE